MMAEQRSQEAASVLFLDFDETLCLNRPYGGGHLLMRPQPADLHLHLWHPPALKALLEVVENARPSIVLTTTWLRFLDLPAARELFKRTGAELLAQQLHPQGEAPQIVGQSRLQAIDAWMARNGRPDFYAILDDPESGTGLIGSAHDAAGRVVLCTSGRGVDAQTACALLAALKVR